MYGNCIFVSCEYQELRRGGCIMKCVSYTRTLPWRIEEECVEISRQNKIISEFIHICGWSLKKKYSDRKSDMKADIAFEQLIHDGMERKYDCIVVYSLYYCGTSFSIVKHMILDTLIEAGIHLVVVSEKFDSSQKSRDEIQDYFEGKRREMHSDILKRWINAKGKSPVLTVPVSFVKLNNRENYKKINPLAAIISCENCGSPVQRRSNYKTSDSWFICKNSCTHNEKGQNVKIPAEEVFNYVIEWICKEKALAKKAELYIHKCDLMKQIEEHSGQLLQDMKSILDGMKSEQSRRLAFYERYSQGIMAKEEYKRECNTFLEACERLNVEFSKIMKDVSDLERAYSVKNPWILLFSRTDIPIHLDKDTIHKLIDNVTVGFSAELKDCRISITPKFNRWKKMILDTVTEGEEYNG